MRESGAEIGTIDGAMSRGFGRVEVFATGAVKFDSFFVRNVGEADGKKRMSEAQDSGTSAKVSFFVFLHLRRKVSSIFPERRVVKQTILLSPLDVMIHLACIRPYRSLACTSTEFRSSSSTSSSCQIGCSRMFNRAQVQSVSGQRHR